MTITTEILEGIADLGVPWWGWAALIVMIFWGLLVPGAQVSPLPSEELPTLPTGRG
jgi:hypothetical protein